MKYEKEIVNQAFEVKEHLEGKEKRAIENLIAYTNKIFATYNEIEDTQPELNRLYEKNDKLSAENSKLKKLLKSTSREREEYYRNQVRYIKKSAVKNTQVKENVI